MKPGLESKNREQELLQHKGPWEAPGDTAVKWYLKGVLKSRDPQPGKTWKEHMVWQGRQHLNLQLKMQKN
jgi:hypothetical protein